VRLLLVSWLLLLVLPWLEPLFSLQALPLAWLLLSLLALLGFFWLLPSSSLLN